MIAKEYWELTKLYGKGLNSIAPSFAKMILLERIVAGEQNC